MKAVVRYKNGLHEIVALSVCPVYPPAIRITDERPPRSSTVFDRKGELRDGTPLYVERVVGDERVA